MRLSQILIQQRTYACPVPEEQYHGKKIMHEGAETQAQIKKLPPRPRGLVLPPCGKFDGINGPSEKPHRFG
jgi:hypothetical protein